MGAGGFPGAAAAADDDDDGGSRGSLHYYLMTDVPYGSGKQILD